MTLSNEQQVAIRLMGLAPVCLHCSRLIIKPKQDYPSCELRLNYRLPGGEACEDFTPKFSRRKSGS